jgi:hypothetical protein
MSDIRVNRVSNVGTEEDDRRETIRQFMRELCRRDSEVNRGQDDDSNTFTIKEIKEGGPNAFDLEFVRTSVRIYANEDDPDIELVDEEHVSLTNRGRNRGDNNEFDL